MVNGYNKAKMEGIESDISEMKDDIRFIKRTTNEISIKVAYMYGWAAGAGAIAGLVSGLITKLLVG